MGFSLRGPPQHKPTKGKSQTQSDYIVVYENSVVSKQLISLMIFVLKLNLIYDIPPRSYPGGFNLLRCQQGLVGYLHAEELSTPRHVWGARSYGLRGYGALGSSSGRRLGMAHI